MHDLRLSDISWKTVQVIINIIKLLNSKDCEGATFSIKDTVVSSFLKGQQTRTTASNRFPTLVKISEKHDGIEKKLSGAGHWGWSSCNDGKLRSGYWMILLHFKSKVFFTTLQNIHKQ